MVLTMTPYPIQMICVSLLTKYTWEKTWITVRKCISISCSGIPLIGRARGPREKESVGEVSGVVAGVELGVTTHCSLLTL